MKLGEALTVRKRQAEKLGDLRKRIQANALVQEGDEPSEDAVNLLETFERLSAEHSALVRNINQTNIRTEIAPGQTLLDMISDKDHLSRMRNALSEAIAAASPSRSDFRFMRTELKFVPKVDVVALRTKLEQKQEEINNLDMEIQEANWNTDLIV
jgi:hypothetical protein